MSANFDMDSFEHAMRELDARRHSSVESATDHQPPRPSVRRTAAAELLRGVGGMIGAAAPVLILIGAIVLSTDRRGHGPAPVSAEDAARDRQMVTTVVKQNGAYERWLKEQPARLKDWDDKRKPGYDPDLARIPLVTLPSERSEPTGP